MGYQHDPPMATCLGRTCLKWQSNGELSDQDLSLVLERLQEAETMTASRVGLEPLHSGT
jgi:hypothetical protein